MPYNYYIVQTDTDSIIAGLHDYSKANSGVAPEHAIQLVVGDYITESNLCAVELYSTNYIADPVPVAGRTLEQVLDINLEEYQRDIYVQFAIDDLPEDVIAHRLGDYIFTYHGIDLANPPDKSLWVVVMYPDPSHADKINTGYIVGTVNYGTEYIDSADFDVRLEEQNQIRVDCGLAPLPDLSTITNGSPASGADQ